MKKQSRRNFIKSMIKAGKFKKEEIILQVKNAINQEDYSTTHEMALTSIISELKRDGTFVVNSGGILSINENLKRTVTKNKSSKIQGDRRNLVVQLLKDGKYTKADILKIVFENIDQSLYVSSHEQAIHNIIKQYQEAGILAEKQDGILVYQ